MNHFINSKVEQSFFSQSGNTEITTLTPYIVVDNFPQLGLLTALRFLEWAQSNPQGVISLPTGKTPEYFIKWTKHILENWDTDPICRIKADNGLVIEKMPDLSGLHFVQIDEFYPINPRQHNSFYNYVNKFYIDGFGLDSQKALLINSDEIPLADNKHFMEIFPDLKVDLSLRYRDTTSLQEEIQQKSILMIDQWCTEYEDRIKELGGIGFFLGGIGPDGHIAFNIKGSDHNSTTRLTQMNFETQAVSAADLGGFDVARHRLVITIGLKTITSNPDAVSIIFATGEAKAGVVSDAITNEPDNLYPGTVLQKLKNARFYITRGAAIKLKDMEDLTRWPDEKKEKYVIELCAKINKFGKNLVLDDLENDEYCKHIPDLNIGLVEKVKESINAKITRGIQSEQNQVFLHTGPHHDDIVLGLMPYIARQLRSKLNQHYFAIMTSGFTAITNQFVIDSLKDTKKFLNDGLIQMVQFDDFFKSGYKYKWDKDVYHYLMKVASGDNTERRRGICHRMVRIIVDIYKVKNVEELNTALDKIIIELQACYDGEKNSPEIQKLKGMIRELEEELTWAHYGVKVKNIRHLRLGFYTGDIFTQTPEYERDVKPILDLLEEVNPTVLSLTLDPEGAGPDTHYKVLQATAEAVRRWGEKKDISQLRIWGYRNVWYRFNPAEANVMVPVSLNAMAVLNDVFNTCYLSQVDAPFPSYECNCTFSELAQKIWVSQLKDVQMLMGKDYFYQHNEPKVLASHGLLYFKELNVEEFFTYARDLESMIAGVNIADISR